MYRRLLIFSLGLLLVLSTDSFARKRNKEGARKEGSEKKKRSDSDMFSIPEEEEEKEGKE